MTVTVTVTARRLITKIRSGRLKHNPDVTELCRMLAEALDLGDIDVAHKPPPKGLYSSNKKEYSRLYMRWYREMGQSGEYCNSEKTHCPHGHEYSPENTSTHPRGRRQWRHCKTCHRLASQRWRDARSYPMDRTGNEERH